ncbi:sterol response element binding protein cleavage-activating protein, putative, partial [Ixodes scapularis]
MEEFGSITHIDSHLKEVPCGIVVEAKPLSTAHRVNGVNRFLEISSRLAVLLLCCKNYSGLRQETKKSDMGSISCCSVDCGRLTCRINPPAMQGVTVTSSPAKSYTIKDRIAQIYYKHGLYCSSHPLTLISFAIFTFLIACYPLLHIPLLGSSSQQFSTPIALYSAELDEDSQTIGPRWGPPVAYVQQVVVKAAVSPWQQSLMLMDAFRSPLAESFHLTELINNHQFVDRQGCLPLAYDIEHANNSTVHTLQDMCMQVSEPKDKVAATSLPQFGCLTLSPTYVWKQDYNSNSTVHTLQDMCMQVSEPKDKVAATSLPQFGCLTLSPTYVWKQDYNSFRHDSQILMSIFDLKDETSDSYYLREILFGVPWKETGIKKLCVRNRQRVITFAVTMVLKKWDPDIMHSLEDKLRQAYPSHSHNSSAQQRDQREIVHVHFQYQHTLAEFVPLGTIYFVLFFYIYFSVRKIELVKSKWAISVSAVLTVVMSLFMSVGLCLWFGLNPTLNGSPLVSPRSSCLPSEILPYLVVVVGLENMLVLTKSVVSTPVHVGAKVRLAQGLSKEGWSITKNLLTELLLLTFAFLTFVPAIQKFDLKKGRSEASNTWTGEDKNLVNTDTRNSVGVLYRSRRSDGVPVVTYGSNRAMSRIFATPTSPILKLPKRLRLVYFWARMRLIQRGLMASLAGLGLVVWIVVLIHSMGIVGKFTDSTGNFGPNLAESGSSRLESTESSSAGTWKCIVTAGTLTEEQVQSSPGGGLVHPASRAEATLVLALSIPTVLFIVYLFVTLYRCMCSRNYAEWRTSWSTLYPSGCQDPDTFLVMDTYPIELRGHSQPGASAAVSGCQDGVVCVWDLMTGTCAYSLTAHRGAVLALRTTGLYMLSLGSDSRLRIWEKSQGHLLHTLYQANTLCNNMALLSDNIVVTAKE